VFVCPASKVHLRCLQFSGPAVWFLIPFRVRAKINSQILSVEAPAGQGAKAQEYQAYSELLQRRPAGCIGA
jgi:hypothetical protein